MFILGLDISTAKIGVAVLDSDEELIKSDVIKFDSKKSLEERAFIFYDYMRELAVQYPISHVCVESPFISFLSYLVLFVFVFRFLETPSLVAIVRLRVLSFRFLIHSL